jgi:hypothetical protein
MYSMAHATLRLNACRILVILYHELGSECMDGDMEEVVCLFNASGKKRLLLN